MSGLRSITRAVTRLACACVAYGMAVEPRLFRVRHASATVLPAGSRPLRVLHLSDVHLLPRQRAKLDFIKALRGLEPDLVVSTGDHLSSPKAVSMLVDALDGLLDVPGAFVFGSNDFHGPRALNPLGYLWGDTSGIHGGRAVTMRPDELRSSLSRRGWTDLNNARAVVSVQGVELELRGTGDAHEDRDDYPAVAGPARAGTVPLGLTHAPYRRVLDAMALDGVKLVFAGHTHGGQVRLPGYGAVVTNCDLPPSHARGLYWHEAAEASCWVNVSAGLGMSPYAPYRFACPPEVTLMTLCPCE